MNTKYKKEIVDRYRTRLSKCGPTFESLGSGSKKHQNIMDHKEHHKKAQQGTTN